MTKSNIQRVITSNANQISISHIITFKHPDERSPRNKRRVAFLIKFFGQTFIIYSHICFDGARKIEKIALFESIERTWKRIRYAGCIASCNIEREARCIDLSLFPLACFSICQSVASYFRADNRLIIAMPREEKRYVGRRRVISISSTFSPFQYYR